MIAREDIRQVVNIVDKMHSNKSFLTGMIFNEKLEDFINDNGFRISDKTIKVLDKKMKYIRENSFEELEKMI